MKLYANILHVNVASAWDKYDRRVKFFLGIANKRSRKGTYLHQTKYAKEIIKNFKLDDNKEMSSSMDSTSMLE